MAFFVDYWFYEFEGRVFWLYGFFGGVCVRKVVVCFGFRLLVKYRLIGDVFVLEVII